MKRIEVQMDSVPQDVRVGDLLKFQVFPDNSIVYGVYLHHHYDYRNHGEDMCESDSDMYAVFHVIPFGAGNTQFYYDWEFIENLTETERRYNEKNQ